MEEKEEHKGLTLEQQLEKIPLVRYIVKGMQRKNISWLEGISWYDLVKMYINGIIDGAFSYHASSIAFSFFMSLFPFALFILNLIPYIPIEGFQDDFLQFVQESVPPNTYDAVASIINDILNNSHSNLISSGFLLSIFLMANGINGLLGGFETSQHVLDKRGFLHQYLVSLGISLGFSLILLLTVATIVVFEIVIHQTMILNSLSDSIPLIIIGRYAFLVLMILITTSILLKYGAEHKHKQAFISIGSVFTTILIVISSYFFGIWVVKFSKYNELYGSIGTLLIMMFYIWINCMVMLLGFEFNAIIHKLRNEHQEQKESLN